MFAHPPPARGGGWAGQVLMTAAGNCVYGSTLSPPRLQQIQETVDEYFATQNKSDSLFQFWLPHLIKSLKLDFDLASEDVAEDQL